MPDTLSSRIAAFESNIAKSGESQDGSFLVNTATRRKTSRRSSLSDFTPRHHSMAPPPLLVVNARGDLVPAYAAATDAAAAGNSITPAHSAATSEPCASRNNSYKASEASSEDIATVTSNTSRTTSTSATANETAPTNPPASPRKCIRPALLAKVNMLDKAAAPSLNGSGGGGLPSWASPRRAPRGGIGGGTARWASPTRPHAPQRSSTSDSCYSPSKIPQQEQATVDVMSPLTPVTPQRQQQQQQQRSTTTYAPPPQRQAMGRRSSLSAYVPTADAAKSSSQVDASAAETGGAGEDVEYWREEAKKLKEDTEERKRKKAEQEAYRAAAKEKAKKRAEEAKRRKEMAEQENAAEKEAREEIIRKMRESSDEPIITGSPRCNTRRPTMRRSSLSDFVPANPTIPVVVAKSWPPANKGQSEETVADDAAATLPTSQPVASVNPPVTRKFGRRSSTSAYAPTNTTSTVPPVKCWPPPKEQQPAEMAVVARVPEPTSQSAATPARKFGRRSSTSDYVPPAPTTTTTAKNASSIASCFQPTDKTGLLPGASTTTTQPAVAPATTAAPRRFGRRNSLSDFVPPKRNTVANTWQSRHGQTTTPAPVPVPTAKAWKKPALQPSKEVKAAIVIQSAVRCILQRVRYRQMVVDKMYEDLENDDDDDDKDNSIPRTSLRPDMSRGMSFKKCCDYNDDKAKSGNDNGDDSRDSDEESQVRPPVSSIKPSKTRGMSSKEKTTSSKKKKKVIKEEEADSDCDNKVKKSTKSKSKKSKKSKKSIKEEDSSDGDRGKKGKKSTKSKSKKTTCKEQEKTETAPKRKSLSQAAVEHFMPTREELENDKSDDDSSDSGDEESTLGSWGNSGPRVPIKSKWSSMSNSNGTVGTAVSDSSNETTKLELQYTFVFQR